jgi:hypothetical protein
MPSTLWLSTGVRVALLAGLIGCWFNTPGLAAEVMPVTQQNALVQKYCVVCHNASIRNGGLSLADFDAAAAAPSLTAMMLGKLKAGALGAAGLPQPDKVTTEALIHAFTIQSAGATEWTVERTKDAELVASIVREVPAPNNPGGVELYRLIVSCKPTTHSGSIDVAWSPTPQTGALTVAVDGKASVSYTVKGSERMGTGSMTTFGIATVRLADMRTLPAQSLTIRDLFPGDLVVFPFASFEGEVRRQFSVCFLP